jgi:serine protease Do
MKIITALALLCLASPAMAWDQTAMNTMVDQTNFLVNQNCSGTLIGDAKYGYILTAHHCIMDTYRTVTKRDIQPDGTVKERKVQVSVPGTVSQIYSKGSSEVQRNSYIYKVVADDDKYDLALLHVETALPNHEGAPMSCKPLTRGDEVTAVGNAYVVLYSSVSKGTVASITRSYRDLGLIGDLGDATDDGNHGLVQHTALISGGNSGGALYNAKGEFVGVNVRGGGGWSFAVPYSDVKTFLINNGHGNMFASCEKPNG